MTGRRYAAISVAVLLCVGNAAVSLRVAGGGAEPGALHPDVHHHVKLRMDADLGGAPARIRVFLPQDDTRQSVEAETIESSRLACRVRSDGETRTAVWTARDAEGHVRASYEADVRVRPAVFELPEGVPLPARYPPAVLRYLERQEPVRHGARAARGEVDELLSGTQRGVTATIRALYDLVRREVAAGGCESGRGAASGLEEGEGSCGSHARRLVALLRAAGVPARGVGGLLLTPGAERPTHLWVEAWVGGVWVPFDPVNGHFAERPATHLVLYRGDRTRLAHAEGVRPDYRFRIEERRSPRGGGPGPAARRAGLDASLLWESFRRAGIPLDLVRIALLLPFGALVLVILRNVVGLTTFGTFHPALIAVAFRDTGLVWGIGLYGLLLAVGFALRVALDRLQLLQTPRLALLLGFVVAFMLAATYVSACLGLVEPARISMFPIAILAMTVENLFTQSEELGARQAVGVLAQTLAAIAVVYAVIESDVVQALAFGCPEILIGVAAAYVGLGRWMGLRLVEYRRFRWLLVE